MGDSETVVAQTSTVMAYTSEGYASIDHANAAPDTVTSATGASGDVIADVPTDVGDIATSTDNMDADNTVVHGQSVGDEFADNKDQNSAKDEVPNNMNHDTSQNLTNSANVSMDTSQVTAYDSSLNGNEASEAKNVVSAGISENGNTSDVHESISEHQLVDVSGIPYYIY